MPVRLFPDRSTRLLFWAAVAVCLGFACLTQHVWEDYWITFKSSRNLATGQGLVYTPGERLHTFTSPLGVLLPALCSLVTGNASDAAALWLFRAMSSAAFAAGVVLLVLTARRLQWPAFAAAALALALLLDVKSVDFTINGMETGLLIGFLALMLHAAVSTDSRRWWRLGLAWAGLMWTRPDSFLTVGLFGVALLLFSEDRRAWWRDSLRAGLLCTVLYLPWLIFAHLYYGSAVPHTITAKGGVSDGRFESWSAAIETLRALPGRIWTGDTSLDGALLPSYVQLGGWPESLVLGGRLVALVAALLWMLPVRLGAWVRAASFTFFGLHVYLSTAPSYFFPWYQPGPLVFACFALAGAGARLHTATQAYPRLKRILIALVAVVFGAQAWLAAQATRQIYHEQRVVADVTRRGLGEWLRGEAQPDDTVFMEPLGHIGYFSGLKTYDYPGLSSREVTDAIATVGGDWSTLIDYLAPDWVVLRPFEIERINRLHPTLLHDRYLAVREFDQSAAVAALPNLRGRPYLEHDARFTVFRHRFGETVPVTREIDALKVEFPLPVVDIEGQHTFMLQPPGTAVFPIPPRANFATIGFGVPEEAWNSPVRTTGMEFELRWRHGPESGRLFLMMLRPAEVEADRGVRWFKAGLPVFEDGDAELVLITRAGFDQTMDWACWTEPQFTP